MAFFRKAGSILKQTVGRQLNSEICGANPSVFQAIRCMSSSKVFVGGLSWNTDDQSLGEAFGKYGQVYEAKVIMDRETSRSRGFGFVTFGTPEEASAAIQALDQQELDGRRVRVNYANERPPRTGGFGGGYGGGGGGYGGGGSYGGGGGYGGGGYGGGGGYNQGGDNYSQGGGNYNQGGGNFSQDVGNFGGGDFAAGGGGGGADSFGSGDVGADASFGNASGFDGGNVPGAFEPDGSNESNRDDDDVAGDYAKRA